MAEKRSVTQILYPHPHRRPCTPGQMPIPSCELKTRKHVNVISYAEWKEEKSPRYCRVQGCGRGATTRGIGIAEKDGVPKRARALSALHTSTSSSTSVPRDQSAPAISHACLLACLLGCWVGTYVHPPKLSVIELTVPYLPRIPHLHPRSS